MVDWMKIGLVGFGKMGRLLEELSGENGCQVVAIIDPVAKEATARQLSADSLKDVDVCIDFSTPEAAVENIKKYCSLKKNAVVATTGWYDKVEEVKKTVEDAGIGLIFASNFSIGVNALFRIIENAARIMDKLPEYDVSGLEMHHKGKKDSPSGTAKSIEKILEARDKIAEDNWCNSQSWYKNYDGTFVYSSTVCLK